MQHYTFLKQSLVNGQHAATILIKSYFAEYISNNEITRTIISNPTYSVSSNGDVIVQLYYYYSAVKDKNRVFKTDIKEKYTKINPIYLNSLVSALSRLFTGKFTAMDCDGFPRLGGFPKKTYPTSLSVQLRVLRLSQPYLNSSILAHYLSIAASKYGFARLRHYVLSVIPLTTVSNPTTSSVILGVKVQVSGLLTTQRNAPRKTVFSVYTGTFHGPNTHIDYASYTNKSANGSYTVKV